MDVGLNNKNTLGEIAPEFKDVVYFVQGDSQDSWEKWSKESMTNIEPLSDIFIKNLYNNLSGDSFLLKEIEKLNHKVKHIYHERFDWEQIYAGFMLTIGHVKKMPVCVSFSFAMVNGHKVCFYEDTSQVIDHEMIKKWLITRFQLTHDNYSRWNHSNTTNFHPRDLDKLDKEPRDTEYKHEKYSF